MTNKPQKWRKVLRRIYCSIGVAAISVVVNACYGMPLPKGGMPPQDLIPSSEEGAEAQTDADPSGVRLNERQE